MSNPVFYDRHQAGDQLAVMLSAKFSINNSVAVGIAKGGIPVAIQTATALNIPLDIIAVRKLIMPSSGGDIIGALTSNGDSFIRLDISVFGKNYRRLVDKLCRFEKNRLQKMERNYRQDQTRLALAGKNIILIDEGSQTGSSLLAAIKAVRKDNPASITAALPVATNTALDSIRGCVDEVVCLRTISADSQFQNLYRTEKHLDDLYVRRMLHQHWHRQELSTQNETTISENAQENYKYKEVVHHANWSAFNNIFSETHIGWHLTVRSTSSDKPNQSRQSANSQVVPFVNDAPFIGISYIPEVDNYYIRYLHQKKIYTFRLEKPIRLTFYKISHHIKSLHIEIESGETFKVQISRKQSDSDKMLGIRTV